MKLLIKIIILALIITIFIILIPSRTISQENKGEPLLSIGGKAGDFSLNIREQEKEELKKVVKKIKDFIYLEATEHNPSGDLLPDQIDDNVIKEVKEKVN